jgi:hypothetical protein
MCSPLHKASIININHGITGLKKQYVGTNKWYPHHHLNYVSYSYFTLFTQQVKLTNKNTNKLTKCFSVITEPTIQIKNYSNIFSDNHSRQQIDNNKKLQKKNTANE